MMSPRWFVVVGTAALFICLAPTFSRAQEPSAAPASPASCCWAAGPGKVAETEVQPRQRFSDHRNNIRSQRVCVCWRGTPNSAQHRKEIPLG